MEQRWNLTQHDTLLLIRFRCSRTMPWRSSHPFFLRPPRGAASGLHPFCTTLDLPAFRCALALGAKGRRTSFWARAGLRLRQLRRYQEERRMATSRTGRASAAQAALRPRTVARSPCQWKWRTVNCNIVRGEPRRRTMGSDGGRSDGIDRTPQRPRLERGSPRGNI